MTDQYKRSNMSKIWYALCSIPDAIRCFYRSFKNKNEVVMVFRGFRNMEEVYTYMRALNEMEKNLPFPIVNKTVDGVPLASEGKGRI